MSTYRLQLTKGNGVIQPIDFIIPNNTGTYRLRFNLTDGSVIEKDITLTGGENKFRLTLTRGDGTPLNAEFTVSVASLTPEQIKAALESIVLNFNAPNETITVSNFNEELNPKVVVRLVRYVPHTKPHYSENVTNGLRTTHNHSLRITGTKLIGFKKVYDGNNRGYIRFPRPQLHSSYYADLLEPIKITGNGTYDVSKFCEYVKKTRNITTANLSFGIRSCYSTYIGYGFIVQYNTTNNNYNGLLLNGYEYFGKIKKFAIYTTNELIIEANGMGRITDKFLKNT